MFRAIDWIELRKIFSVRNFSVSLMSLHEMESFSFEMCETQRSSK